MIKHIYICDRCKAEQNNPKQMWNIILRVSSVEIPDRTTSTWIPENTPMWCRKCVDAMQMIEVPKTTEKNPIPVKVISLEDKIREAITEEVQNLINDNR